MTTQNTAGAVAGAPIITELQVVPVAGHDSMLLNLSGAHGPFFTRNILILKDNAGRIGVGEVPGGEAIRQTLEDARPLLVGQSIGNYNGLLNQVRKAFANLSGKQNVTAKFIGYADEMALSDRNARIYGDAVALSKARAHRTALAVQQALGLPAAAVQSDGRGATTFLAANDTPQGRALNLAYVMIGSMMTTVQDVTREQITRDACREATHFVYKTEVGAFAIAAGENSEAR